MAVKVLIASRSEENCSSRDLVCAIVWLNSVSDRASCAEWRSLACEAMVWWTIGNVEPVGTWQDHGIIFYNSAQALG